MPTYEFTCLTCKIVCELNVSQKITFDRLLCPDCNSQKLRLDGFDLDRVETLRGIALAVEQIRKRVENIETVFETDPNQDI
jgi:Zn finger protein HypA/HybF involved in hydrogenase expression